MHKLLYTDNPETKRAQIEHDNALAAAIGKALAIVFALALIVIILFG